MFREWGVLSSEDIGRIVFELVECGQLSARPEDRLEDFLAAPELMPLLTGHAAAEQFEKPAIGRDREPPARDLGISGGEAPAGG